MEAAAVDDRRTGCAHMAGRRSVPGGQEPPQGRQTAQAALSNHHVLQRPLRYGQAASEPWCDFSPTRLLRSVKAVQPQREVTWVSLTASVSCTTGVSEELLLL